MANRHANKALRRHIHQRMASTGESYQTALEAVRRGTPHAPRAGTRDTPRVELLVAHYFGAPITLPIFEASAPVGRPIILRVPSSRAWHPLTPTPTPMTGFRKGGWQ